VVYLGVIDLYFYIVYKKYNNCPTGLIQAYIGLFGKGKTLSVVKEICRLYRKKNNKMVWCPRRKKMVRQKIKIISNVQLSIPYEDFISLEQIVRCSEKNRNIDDENATLTITLVLGDEFSVQMNSRSFKTNINALFLNTILTCRHHYISLYYTAQRFKHVDALMRQITGYVVDCNKIWRLQGQKYYDAWEMENATTPDMLKSKKRKCKFITNKDYNAYNTLACVNNLKKTMELGDMLSDTEILALQCNNPNMENIINPSRKLVKIFKKKSA